jgi:hypothetical protein
MEELARQALELNLGVSEALAFRGRLRYVCLPKYRAIREHHLVARAGLESAPPIIRFRGNALPLILDIRYKRLICLANKNPRTDTGRISRSS